VVAGVVVQSRAHRSMQKRLWTCRSVPQELWGSSLDLSNASGIFAVYAVSTMAPRVDAWGRSVSSVLACPTGANCCRAGLAERCMIRCMCRST